MIFHTLHFIRLVYFAVFKPVLRGVRVIALTPNQELILIRHTYGKPQWMLPGGGVSKNESPAQAALKELREEIGLTHCADLSLYGSYQGRVGRATDMIDVFVARNVTFNPRQSWLQRQEIAAIASFPLMDLPADLSPATARRLKEWQGLIPKDAVW